MSAHRRLITQAAQLAYSNKGIKSYFLGAIGIRNDGTIVRSYNIPNVEKNIHAHAEIRLCKKLDTGSTVYVARVSKIGRMLLARPCPDCFYFMKQHKVRKCYYSISDFEYGVIEF